MRAAPALELTVAPERGWRAAVAALGAAALAALLGWVFAASIPAPGWRAAALLLCLPLFAALPALASRTLLLRWDGRDWHWRDAAEGQAQACSGRLGVVADLGGWMLLRLQPSASRLPWHGRWIALARRSHAAHWHALRCAVYSPTPAAPRHGDPPPFTH
ncbi:hypothetical protein [Caldimonas tepidiphila]|uniref:hypothetical protein n=1 Tax=Caldimonas tepidiphila TaxID=2315841 RepID=UPI000E5B1228|nr:hypothetical protein [Caldimonas tepidiphila]